MNEVSTLIKYVVDWFAANSLVNTIVMAADWEIDSQKENIYPIVAIDYKESDVTTDTVICYFNITVLQQRNISPTATDSKLMFDSNMLDNFNEAFAILNQFVLFLENQNNDKNIEIVSRSRFTVIKNRPTNGLDGYKFSCGLSIPNTTKSCSQN